MPEVDQLAGLPSKYDYIRDVVMKYTRSGRDAVKQWKASITALSPQQLAEIATVYQRMAAQDDAEGLSAWIKDRIPEVRAEWDRWSDACSKCEMAGLPAPPEPQQVPRAQGLYELFDFLRDQKVAPFRSGKVEFCPPPTVLDWTKLPPALSYLAEPARKWGVYWAEDHRRALKRGIKKAQLCELQELAARIRTPEHWALIQKFNEEHKYQPEASFIFYLLWVLNELVPWPADGWVPSPSDRASGD